MKCSWLLDRAADQRADAEGLLEPRRGAQFRSIELHMTLAQTYEDTPAD